MSEPSNPPQHSADWYIIKHSMGTCEIISSDRLETENDLDIVERWGPFPSSQDAIARRIGLIRARKCQPQ